MDNPNVIEEIYLITLRDKQLIINEKLIPKAKTLIKKSSRN